MYLRTMTSIAISSLMVAPIVAQARLKRRLPFRQARRTIPIRSRSPPPRA